MLSLPLLACLLYAIVAVDGTSPRNRTEWMQGNWGVGFRIDAIPSYWNGFNVTQFIDQLRTMTGKPSWVIVNLSGPSHWGDSYLSHHPLLQEELGNTNATPPADGRDLFQELADAIHGEGLKVIAYMAGQGPALLKLTKQYHDKILAGESHLDAADRTLNIARDWNGVTSPGRDNWLDYVAEKYNCDPLEYTTFFVGEQERVNAAFSYTCAKEAYAKEIVSYYAKKFGSDIDGYWFDQGLYANGELLAEACHSGNPDAAIAFNNGVKVPLQANNPNVEDYTFGHPNPLRGGRSPPSSDVNQAMVEAVEASEDGYFQSGDWEVLGHMFLPMSKTSWNGIGTEIDPGWSDNDGARAKDWMSRVLENGGAWTWNIPRASWDSDPARMSILAEGHVDFLNAVTTQITPSSVPSVSQSPSTSTLPSAIPSVSQVPSTSSVPSAAPSDSHPPSNMPSVVPSTSQNPSRMPSLSRSPSIKPTSSPSSYPSREPSTSETPSGGPSGIPSDLPSDAPSDTPSFMLSDVPSNVPSDIPSDVPSDIPTSNPSDVPSSIPSDIPSINPSDVPSSVPSDIPSDVPSEKPISIESDGPSSLPTTMPTELPSTVPSDSPSAFPSPSPSVADSDEPTTALSLAPSASPSRAPSGSPSKADSANPSSTPSETPTAAPSTSPTAPSQPDDNDWETCDDGEGKFSLNTNKKKSCSWLRFKSQSRIDKLCEDSAVAERCVETCGDCSDNCEDDTAARFRINGNVGDKNCKWIGKKQSRINTYCKPSHVAFYTCRETCEACHDEHNICNNDGTCQEGENCTNCPGDCRVRNHATKGYCCAGGECAHNGCNRVVGNQRWICE